MLPIGSANIRFNCKEQAVQCTRTKREKFAESSSSTERSSRSNHTRVWSPTIKLAIINSTRVDPRAASEQRHYRKMKKLENEETMENKNHLPEYKHRDKPGEKLYVEGRDHAAEPPE